MRLSIKTKALLLFCPIIIAISIAYTVAAIQTEQKLLREEIIKRGELLVIIAAKSAELPLLSENQEVVHNAAASLIEIKDIAFVTFYNTEFEIIVHQGAPVTPQSPATMPLEPPLSVRENANYFEFYHPVFSVYSGNDADMFEELTLEAPLKKQIGWVRVGLTKEIVAKVTRRRIVNSTMFAVLLVVIAIVLVHFILSIALKPLNVLFSAVKGLQDGEYPQLPEIDTGGEIGQLSAEFNKMSHTIKDREQRLMHSQKKISELFERVEHALFRLDVNFKITEGNRMLFELCDLDTDFFSLLDEKGRENNMKAALAGELVDVETVICDRDKAKHIVILSLYPDYDPDGSITGFDGHLVDITQTKKLEDALHQTQKLESLGLLAGGVAHDFNNILTVILGYTEVVMMKLAEDDPLLPSIKIISDAGIRASNLTRQLLAFSRKQVMEMQVFNLNNLIKNMTKMLGRLIGENIDIKLNLRNTAGNIKADPGQVEQIIMNLAVNARDAMPEGGSLILETDTVEFDKEYCRSHAEASPGNYVVLYVTDTGQGLEQEIIENIFDPFFTTKAKGVGTGLGLSTVYGIMKQLKGHIHVYSEVGSGTTFKIYFPEIKEAVKEMDAGQKKVMERGTETILVVDDEPSIRNTVYDTLQSRGYNVLKADCGEGAIAISKKTAEKIDLLLTDVIMPGMSCRELAKTMQDMRPDIKVLYMSGYTDNIIAREGVLEPNIFFINKPLIPSLLIKKIREILENDNK